jgi:ribosomal protein S18 acetylase RimI-like enzyme
MIPGLQTRPAAANDQSFVWAVHKQAFQPYVAQVWGWGEARLRALFEEEYDQAQTEIVLYQGERVGYLRLEDHGDWLFLDSIAIAPDYQGRGLGTALVRRILHQAAGRGLPVRLHVLRVNPARTLYERLGFRLTGGDADRCFMEAGPATGNSPAPG